MKKIILIFIMLLSVLIPCFAEGVTNVYDWKYNGSGAGVINGDGKNRSFLVYFTLVDSEKSDLYCNIGFSQLPFIKGGDIQGYDGNKLQMAWNGWGVNETVKLKASTYIYWHVVVEGNHKLRLELTPSTGADVVCTYSKFNNETKVTTPDTDDYVVKFTEIGRHYGSTLLNIDATVNKFSFTNNVVCTLKLVLESGT